MGLTFENANLDFAGDYAAAARACGDVATADALDAGPRRRDPPRPLRLGVAAPARRRRRRAWDAYIAHVRFPLGPHRARGARFDRDARRRAGLDESFIDALDADRAEAAERTKPR